MGPNELTLHPTREMGSLAPTGLGGSKSVSPSPRRMGATLTDSEHRVVVALTLWQPMTFRELAVVCCWASANTAFRVVEHLRRLRIVPESRGHARSVRLADDIIVSERGQIGRWLVVS